MRTGGLIFLSLLNLNRKASLTPNLTEKLTKKLNFLGGWGREKRLIQYDYFLFTNPINGFTKRRSVPIFFRKLRPLSSEQCAFVCDSGNS